MVRAAVTRDCEPGVAALLNKIDRERTAVHNRKIRNNLQDNEIIVSHDGSDRQKNCSEDIHEDKDSDSEASGILLVELYYCMLLIVLKTNYLCIFY